MIQKRVVLSVLLFVMVITNLCLPVFAQDNITDTLETETGTIPQDKYVFVDTHRVREGIGNVGPFMFIDFPEYRYNPTEKVLLSYQPLRFDNDTKVIMGKGLSLTGTAGSGAATGLTCYDTLSLENQFNISADGTLQYCHEGTWITLKPGEQWSITMTLSVPQGADGKLTETFTIINYGILDKSKISAPLSLVITKAQWFTAIENGFGIVYLHVSGWTDCEKVVIRIMGDGLAEDRPIQLDEKKNFDEIVPISFTHAPDNTTFTQNTLLKAYIGDTVLKKELYGWALNYFGNETENRVTGTISSDISELRGFKVEVMDTYLSTVSMEDGKFMLRMVPDGTYSIKISKKNYLTRIIPNVVVKGEDIKIPSDGKPFEMYIGDMEKDGKQDGCINMIDIMEVAVGFGSSTGSERYDLDRDLNRDGAVNMSDIMIIAKNFNKTTESY